MALPKLDFNVSTEQRRELCGHTAAAYFEKTHQLPRWNIIGKRIREARLKSVSPVSQDDLAGRLAVQGVVLDQTAISRIERQERYLIYYEVAAIAKVFKIPVKDLFDF